MLSRDPTQQHRHDATRYNWAPEWAENTIPPLRGQGASATVGRRRRLLLLLLCTSRRALAPSKGRSAARTLLASGQIGGGWRALESVLIECLAGATLRRWAGGQPRAVPGPAALAAIDRSHSSARRRGAAAGGGARGGGGTHVRFQRVCDMMIRRIRRSGRRRPPAQAQNENAFFSIGSVKSINEPTL
eukprot:COSAG01_NODE_1627_length_9684_cov_16.787063_3_plen_188_part_00